MTTPPKAPAPIAHGSYRGYRAHRNQNIPMCDDCREARNQWERDRRTARAEAVDRSRLTNAEQTTVIEFMERGINHRLMVEFIESRIAERLLRYT